MSATVLPRTPGTTRCVVRADAGTDPRWAALAVDAPGGLFTAPPWIRAVCSTYGFTATARIAVDGDRPVGGAVSVDVDDHRGLRRLSLPFCDRSDPALSDAGSWTLLRADLTGDGVPFTMRCFGSTPPADGHLRRIHEAAWHGTSTTRGIDEIFARLRPAARRNIRAARSAGVTVTTSTDLDAVHRFFDLHLDLRARKYRLLAQPRAFFERIWAEFAPGGRIITLLARLDGEVVAGGLFLEWADVLYYKFGASLREHLAARPNDALFWAALSCACERGLRLVDWGLSELDQPGLVGFKRKWSDVERRIVTLTSAPDPPAGPAPLSSTFADLTALLTRDDVPRHVTEQAGALLYRYFC